MVWPTYIQNTLNTQQANRRSAIQADNIASVSPGSIASPVGPADVPAVTPGGPTIADRIVEQQTPFESRVWNGSAPPVFNAFQSDNAGTAGEDYVYTGPGSSPATGGFPRSTVPEYTGPGSSPATGGLPPPSTVPEYTGPGSSPGTGGIFPKDAVDSGSVDNGPVLGLSDADFQAAADRLGVDVATVRAVAEVESNGSGFLESGDPAILFERHKFHKHTGGVHDALHPNLSSETPGDYGPRWQHQHDRLDAAIALDETAALQSASWGAFQILGENHEEAGYDNVHDFVAAMRESESNHLDAFVSFVEFHPDMLTALQNRNWASFAAAYNVRNYAKNEYDIKMADAYARHIS